MRLTLENFKGEREGWVQWDPGSGALSGPMAERVQARIDDAVTAGFAATHPYPGSFPVSDPLHERREMAAVLGEAWQIPDELADDYPATPDVDPDTLPAGAVF